MMNEEAIIIIENERPHCGKRITFTEEEKCEAYDMAIAALKAEPCEDTISREYILSKAYAYGNGLEPDGYCVNVEDIQKAPPVQPKQRTGKWIDADGDNAICSCCNRLNHLYGAYCKHCGAKMEGENE